LARQISEQHATDDNFIPLVTLSTEWEQIFAESIIENGEERQLSMAPSQLQNFINNVRTAMEDYSEKGESPVMLTSPAIRPFVRAIVERFRPETEIMSQNEIHPKAKIKTLGQI
jgi:flagellar biosynthesis protein FlhA